MENSEQAGTPAPKDGFAAMMANITTPIPLDQSTPEALPSVKGSSRTYYEAAQGKGASWFVSVELVVKSTAEFIVRFVSVGDVKKPPTHLNFRLMSQVTDGKEKKNAFYYDQHHIPVPGASGGLLSFNTMCEAQGVDKTVGEWIARQLELEGLQVTATADQLEYLVKATHVLPVPKEEQVFNPPVDILHVAKPYEKKGE